MASDGLQLGQHVRVTHELQMAERSFGSGHYSTIGGEIAHQPKGEPSQSDRIMWRLPLKTPVVGIVVGYTFRITARYHFGYEGPGWLSERQFHKVWMVASRLRYKLPTLAFEKDMEAPDAD